MKTAATGRNRVAEAVHTGAAVDNGVAPLGRKGHGGADGRFLSNLRSADTIVLFSNSTTEAEAMLAELNEAGRRRKVKESCMAAFATLKEATDHLTDPDLRAHLFDSAVLPAFCCAADTDTAATSNQGMPSAFHETSGRTYATWKSLKR